MSSKYRDKQDKTPKEWPAYKGQIPRLAGQYGRYIRNNAGKVVRVMRRPPKDQETTS